MSTQLAVTIQAYGLESTNCPSQWLRNQDIRQITGGGQSSKSRSIKSSGRSTPHRRVILAGCKCYRKDTSSPRMIALQEFREELQAQLVPSEELQARLVIWEKLQASSILACFED